MTTTPTSAADIPTKRARLEIVNPRTGGGGRVPLRFNPTNYSVKKTQTFSEIAIPGLSSPPLQWVRGGAETLTFKALVDTTHTLENVDEAFVNRLRSLLDRDPELHAPPVVAFVWGRRRFTGVLDGIDISYQLFDERGVPLRAEVSITLKEYRPVAVQVWQERKSSSSVEKTYLVRRGDTIAGIAAAVYQDPARWRELALANGITDPRQLRPGRRLLLPRLT
jgi:nucleoid-associated protein YgaU